MNFRYLLIDTSQQMRFYRRLDGWRASYLSLFSGHAEESLIDIAPLLIDVSDDDETCERIVEEATRIGRLKPCVSLLESPWSLDELAAHLGQFHLVRMPDGRMMVMRWYDTRILPTWFDLLSIGQREIFMEPVAAWTYFDRFGESRSLPVVDSDGASASSVVLPFRLDEAQASALFAASEPDGLIMELRKVIPDEMRRIPYAVLHPFVSEQLRAAYQHGLDKLSDQVQYLLLALYTSGNFVGHHESRKRLATPAQAHEQSFEDWVGGLPDDIWAMGQPLWAETGSVEREG